MALVCSGSTVVVSVDVDVGPNEFKLYSTTGNELSTNAVTVEAMELQVSEYCYSVVRFTNPGTSAL